MTFRCIPVTEPFRARVSVPGSKSVANRALTCAALSNGESTLENVPSGDDTEAMLSCIQRLGIAVQRSEREIVIRRSQPFHTAELHAGLAGTTSRFLTAVAATSTEEILVDGDDRLRARPFGPLIEALRLLGADIRDTNGRLPLHIHGPLNGGSIEIDATMSSQFISALMMIAPTLPGGLQINLRGELISRPYVDLTVSVMEMFGTSAEVTNTQISIEEQRYIPASLVVEPDASSASYPLAIAAVTGSSVTVDGFGSLSRQGDSRITDILREMGAEVDVEEMHTTLIAPSSGVLLGIDVDMSDISDLVPTVAAVACFATSPSRIRGVGFIRAKESDRIGDLAAELRKFGAEIHEHDDGLSIVPQPLHGALVQTHEDHRLAMAFSVIGSRVDGVEINDSGVVSKSWPTYWDDLKQMTGSV